MLSSKKRFGAFEGNLCVKNGSEGPKNPKSKIFFKVSYGHSEAGKRYFGVQTPSAAPGLLSHNPFISICRGLGSSDAQLIEALEHLKVLHV